MNNSKLQLITILGAASITAAAPLAQAGELAPMPAPSAEPKLTGSFDLNANSHFISYGYDVWQAGNSPTDKWTFNPAVALNYQLNDRWSFNSGFWLDVNDNVEGDHLKVQETDIWLGAAYKMGITTIGVTYQNWQYSGDSEQIIDVAFGFDTILSPSILFHNRIDPGAGGGTNGTFLVFGAEHTFDCYESFSVTVPVAAAFALTEFHTPDSDTGFGYASIGLQGSYTINDYSSLNFGLTFYATDADVVGNEDDNFMTYNAGVSFSF